MGDSVKRSSEKDRRMMKKAIAAELFLKSYDLENKQQNHLKAAINHQIPIIISGTRAPAGKTTLCRFLREIGCDAKEIWELDNETNISGMLIMLNKPLKNICPDFYELVWKKAEIVTQAAFCLNDAGLEVIETYAKELALDEKYRRKGSYE